jgi:hypothetical protein
MSEAPAAQVSGERDGSGRGRTRWRAALLAFGVLVAVLVAVAVGLRQSTNGALTSTESIDGAP